MKTRISGFIVTAVALLLIGFIARSWILPPSPVIKTVAGATVTEYDTVTKIQAGPIVRVMTPVKVTASGPIVAMVDTNDGKAVHDTIFQSQAFTMPIDTTLAEGRIYGAASYPPPMVNLTWQGKPDTLRSPVKVVTITQAEHISFLAEAGKDAALFGIGYAARMLTEGNKDSPTIVNAKRTVPGRPPGTVALLAFNLSF